jgi:hypothetical protein
MTSSWPAPRSARTPKYGRVIALLAGLTLAVAMTSLPVAAWGAAHPDAPEATSQDIPVEVGTTRSFSIYSDDDPGDTATFQIVTGSANGALDGPSAPECEEELGSCLAHLTYTPTGSSDDAFSYTATDEAGHVSDPATITFNVFDPDGPQVQADYQDVAKGLTTAITLDGTDSSGEALTFAITSGPVHGTFGAIEPVTCADDSCTTTVDYTPEPGFAGRDSFEYTASNGAKTSDPAPFALRVNAPPSAVADSFSAVSGTQTSVNVLANDSDADAEPGDVLLASADGSPSHGNVSCNGDLCTYTSATGYSGPDTFTYAVDDGYPGGIATATVTVNVTPKAAPAVVKRPGAPRIGSASAGRRGGPKSGVARWTAPASTGGAPITAYVVTATKYQGRNVLRTKSATVSASRRSYDMVVGAGKWRFRVAAVNRVGRGGFSGLSNLVKAK